MKKLSLNKVRLKLPEGDMTKEEIEKMANVSSIKMSLMIVGVHASITLGLAIIGAGILFMLGLSLNFFVSFALIFAVMLAVHGVQSEYEKFKSMAQMQITNYLLQTKLKPKDRGDE